jgi:hypothetical protein
MSGALVVPGCSQGDPGELVISATKATTESHGTFDVGMRFEFHEESEPDDPGEPSGDIELPDDLEFSGAFDGTTSWMEAPPEGLAFDAGEGSIRGLGYLVRNGTVIEELEIDGRPRWFATELEEQGDTSEFLSAPDSLLPGTLLGELRRAAEDPDSVQPAGGNFEVMLSPESIGLVAEPMVFEPEGVEGFDEDPEGTAARVEAVQAWYEAKLRHTATVRIDREGRLQQVRIEMGLDPQDFTDCELLLAQYSFELTVTYTYSESPPDIPDPTPEQIEGADVLEGIMDGDRDELGPEEGPGSAAPSPELDAWMSEPGSGSPTGPLQTVAGERGSYEVLTYLRQWATEAGIDWTTMAIPDEAQMVALFDAFFTQHAEAEGGALRTADGLWLPSDARSVLITFGGQDEAEVEGLTREELTARFDRLYSESGGRGVLVPIDDAWAFPLDDESIDGAPIGSEDSGVSLDGCPG